MTQGNRTSKVVNEFAAKVKASGWLNNLIRRNPLFYSKFISHYNAMQNASLNERRSSAHNLLKNVLDQARKTKYGSSFAGYNDINLWPKLEKDTLRATPLAFVCGSPRLAVTASTGGSTGTPLQLFYSAASIVAEQAALDQVFRIGGVDPRQVRIAVLRGDTIKDPNEMSPPYWKIAGGGRRLLLSAHHLSRQTFAAYYEAITQFHPDCIMAYPSTLEVLCGELSAHEQYLNVPFTVTSSEMLQSKSWYLAEKVLQGRLIDRYGQAERAVFAYGVAPQEYYFLPGYGYVELDFVCTEAGVDLYELIGTPFWNSKSPLVRYKTGDLIRIAHGTSSDELEEICFGLKPFLGIEGRSTDYLLSPEGVRLIAMNHLPREVNNVVQMQIVQDSREQVQILVVPTREYTSEDEEQILTNARMKLPRSMHVTVAPVTELVRTAYGKVPFIIRKKSVEEA